MTPEEKSRVEFLQKRLLHKAKNKAKNSYCPHCSEFGKRRVVPLHEFGDPYMPSSVILDCPKCGDSEVYVRLDETQAMLYANAVKKDMSSLEYLGFIKGDQRMVDKLIADSQKINKKIK